jgi:hypothetical protein
MRTAHGKPKTSMPNNIDAPSEDQKEMADMVEEGKRLGLSPEDLGVNDQADPGFGTRHKDPLNAEKPTGIDEPGDEPEVPKAKEEEPVAKKPEEDEEESEEEDEEDDSSEEGKDGVKPPADSKEFVTKGQLGRFSREMRRGFKEVASAMKEIAAAKTPEAKKEAQENAADTVDEFMTYAQKYKDAAGNPMNSDALKELSGIIEKNIMGKIPLEQIKGMTDLQPVVKSLSDDMNREEVVSAFNNEWKDQGLKIIKAQFPNATEEQITKAENKMFELATSEKYGEVPGKHDAYPLDWIFQKEAEVFKDMLFSPRKKTAEGSSLGDDLDFEEGAAGDNILSTPFEQMTPKKAAAMEAALGKADADEGDYY